MKGQSETRWIILGTDGRHATLGRHADSSEDEIANCIATMQANGMAGWLALMMGGYYVAQKPSLMALRPFGQLNDGDWEKATAAFEATRLSVATPAR